MTNFWNLVNHFISTIIASKFDLIWLSELVSSICILNVKKDFNSSKDLVKFLLHKQAIFTDNYAYNFKKKYLYFYNYKIKCSIGKRGLTSKKIEGDQKTPRGKFKFLLLLYRKDRFRNFHCKIKKPIYKKYGWCDDPNSKHYNKLVKFPYSYSAEKLYMRKSIYDFILVIDFNTKPIRKGLGSVIFFFTSFNRNLGQLKDA